MKTLLLFIPILCASQSVILNDIDSDQLFKTINNFKNKKAVVINFWATTCSPCVEEFPNFVKLQKENKDRLEVVFVSFDLPSMRSQVRDFLKKQNVDWTSFFKIEDDDSFTQKMPEIWDGALPFSMIYRKNGSVEIYLTGKQDFNTLIKHVKRALNKG